MKPNLAKKTWRVAKVQSCGKKFCRVPKSREIKAFGSLAAQGSFFSDAPGFGHETCFWGTGQDFGRILEPSRANTIEGPQTVIILKPKRWRVPTKSKNSPGHWGVWRLNILRLCFLILGDHPWLWFQCFCFFWTLRGFGKALHYHAAKAKAYVLAAFSPQNHCFRNPILDFSGFMVCRWAGIRTPLNNEMNGKP